MVDLQAYAGYDQLLDALQDKFFSHFIIRKHGNDEMKLVDLQVYEDKECDGMLIGDVLWNIRLHTYEDMTRSKNNIVVIANMIRQSVHGSKPSLFPGNVFLKHGSELCLIPYDRVGALDVPF